VDVYNTYNRTPSVADPILSGFKDDLFNLEMENTAYESLKSSLPLPMDNSLDAYRLKSTRSPAQKLEAGAFKTTGLDEYDDRGVGGAMGETRYFVATADTPLRRVLQEAFNVRPSFKKREEVLNFLKDIYLS
jgi:hypothetical protein